MQLDQPALVLSRQMYVENTDGKYDEYIAAYKALTIDVAQLMAYENGGNGPSIDELESFWINLFQIESTIAKVLVILFLSNNVTYIMSFIPELCLTISMINVDIISGWRS